MKKILFLFTSFIGFINSNAQVCTSSSAPTPLLGAAIGPQFVNLWKHAPGIDKYGRFYDTGNTLSIGDDGWPIANQTHDVRFYPGDVHPLLLPGQVIKIRYKGPASAVTSASPWQINYQNIQADFPSTGYTTLEAVIQSNFTTTGFNGLVIQFVGHIEEIQLVRPGYNFDDPRLLVDEFVTHVKTAGWKAFRMMGLSGVNGSFDQTWAKRLSKNAPINVNVWQTRDAATPLGNNPWNFTKSNGMNENLLGNASVGRQRGTSWEDQIDMCNYLNIDMWINVPVLADDNYILELSKLIKQRLKPTLNVHVEIGNEIWNAYGPTFMSGYLQKQIISWEWVNGSAEQKKIFGGTYCPGCGLEPNYGAGYNYGADNNNQFQAWQRWAARRLKEYAEIFAINYGWRDQGGEVGTKIRMILAGQVGYGSNGMAWNIGPGLDFLNAAYGNDAPNKYLYATAVTFYHTPAQHYMTDGSGRTSETLAEFKALSVPQINARLYEELNDNQFGEFSWNQGANSWQGNTYEGVFGKSRLYGLKFFAYEGGNEMSTQGAEFWNRFTNQNEGLGQWNDMDNGDAWFSSASAGTYTTDALNIWYSWFGYDALMMKNGDFQQNPLGGYGLSRTLNESNPVRNAYINVGNNAAPPLSIARGNVIGLVTTTTLDARKGAAYDPNTGNMSNRFVVPTFNPNSNTNLDFEWKFSTINWQVDYSNSNTFDQPYIVRCQKNGRYKIDLLMNEYSWNKVCDIYLNEKLVYANFTIAGSNTGPPATTVIHQDSWPRNYYWTTSSIILDIPYGVHTFRVVPKLPIPSGGDGSTLAQKLAAGAGDNGYSCYPNCNGLATNRITVRSYRFVLQAELPPFQPKPVLGDLSLCNGNAKASYEVGENDPSACTYTWRLPAGIGASLLPAVSVTGTSPVRFSSGPTSYKTLIDWTGVPNGVYTLSVTANNFNTQTSMNQSSVVRTFQVVVTSCGFDYSPAPTCLTDRVTFTPLITPNEKAWKWDFDFNTIPNTLVTRFQTTKFPTTIQWSTPGTKSIEYTVTTNTTTGEQLKFYKTINVFDCSGPTITGFSKIADASSCVATDGQVRLLLTGSTLSNGQVYQIDLDGNGSFGSALDATATLTGFSAGTGILNINTIAAGRTIAGISNMRVRLTTDFSKISPNYTSTTIVVGPQNGGNITLNGSLAFCTAGSTTLTVSGATNYAWSNGGTTNTKTYTTAGNFTVSGTTAGCVLTTAFTTSVVSAPTVAFTGTPSLCVGGNTALTGTGATSYIWSSGATPNATTNTFTPGANTQVTLTGFVGSCSATNIFIITVNSLPVAGITGTRTICSGVSTTLTASGGSPYSWSTGASSTAIVTSTAGTYTVTVTGATGCKNTTTTSVVVNALPTANITGNATICSGFNTTLTGTGGGTYAWSSGETSANIIKNTAGLYTLTVTSPLGCTNTTSTSVVVNANPTVGITATTTICSGVSSTLTASGGGTYVWSNGVTANTTTLSPISTTTYTVTVTGATGCRSITTTSINVNSSPVANAPTRTHITNCGSTDGSITLSATGGVTPYLFSRDNFATSIGTGSFTALAAGTYTGFIRNGSGPACTATVTSIVITTPSAPNVPTFVKTDVTSCVSNNGGLTITGTGGILPYEYSRDGGATWQTSRSFTGLGATSGTIAIRNSTSPSCSITGGAYAITATGAPSFASVTLGHITNCGLSNGTINVVGSGAASYEYSYNGGSTWTTTSAISGLASGNITVGIRNASAINCSTSGVYTLTTPSLPTFTSATPTNPSTCVATDGAIAISATAGSGALQYSTNGGSTWTATANNTSQSAGAYSIYIRNTGGTCTVFGQNLTLSGPNITPMLGYGTTAYCNSSNILTQSGTNLSGGTFRISPTSGVNINSSNGTIASGAAAGIYNVIYTIAGSSFCTGSASTAASVTITAPALVGVVSGGSTPITLGASTGVITLTGHTGNVVNWQVSYNSGAFTNIVATAGQTSYTTTPPAIGSYVYRVEIGNGICANVTNTGQTINVIGTTGAVVGGTSPLCVNQNTGPMTLTGSVGTISNWEYSTDNTNWTSIANTTTLLSGFTPTVSNVTYQFRVSIVGVGTSIARSIVVDASPVSGSISPSTQTLCSGTNYTINLAGQTGNIAVWKSSTDGGTTWSNIFNTSTSAYSTNSTQTTSYVVEVSNGSCANATTTSAIVTIDQPSVGGTVSGGTTPINLGASIGTLNLSGNVGTLVTYQKSYNGGAFTAATNNETPALVGVYEYRAIVQSGVCSTTTSTVNQLITVTGSVGQLSTVPSPVIINGTFTPISITGLNGVVSNWEYSTNNGSTWITIPNTTTLLGSIPTTIYNVENTWQIRASISGVGFTNAASIQVHGLPIITGISRTHVTNCGLTDGTITVTANGNHGLEYSKDGSNWTTTGVFTGLSNGNYPIYVRNANSRFITVSGTNQVITIPSSPSMTTSKVDISNCGGSGSITLNGSGGNAPYEYSLDNFATVSTSGASLTFNNLSAGNYMAYIRNSNSINCSFTTSGITITTPSLPNIVTITSTDVTNCGGSDGNITVNANQGTGTLEYNINNIWSTNATETGLQAGVYDVQVRNQNSPSCSVSGVGNVNINQPNTPSNLMVSQINSIQNCDGSLGGIVLSATFGTPSDLRFSLDGTDWTNTNGTFTGLVSGTSYKAHVRSANAPACSLAGGSFITITAPSVPSITSVNKTDITNCGISDGAVTIVGTGVSSSLEYSIDGSTWAISNVFTGLNSINILPHIRNANSILCYSTATGVTILVPSSPSITVVNKTDITNCGLTDGTITITANGGITPLEYSLNGTTWQTSNVFTGLSTITSTPQVRNQSSVACVVAATSSVTITAPGLPVLQTSPDVAYCVNSRSSTTLTVSGASTYTWSSISSTIIGDENYIVNPTVTSTFIVTGIQGNCNVKKSITITVNPLPSTTMIGLSEVCQNETLTLNAIRADSYAWFPGNVLSTSLSINTSDAGEFTYSVVGTNTTTGCSKTDIKTITVNGIPSKPNDVVLTNVCQGTPMSFATNLRTNEKWFDKNQNESMTGIPSLDFNEPGTKVAFVSNVEKGCESAKATVTGIVFAKPTVPGFGYLKNIFCSNENPSFQRSGISATNGISFSTTSNVTNGFLDASTGDIIDISRFNGQSPITIIMNISSNGACLATTTSQVITVTQFKGVSNIEIPAATYCANATTKTVEMLTTIPGSGVFTAPQGISVSNAGLLTMDKIGIFSITYTPDSYGGCRNLSAVSATITVISPVSGTLIAPLDKVCQGTSVTLISTGHTGDVRWSYSNDTKAELESGSIITTSGITDDLREYKAYYSIQGCPEVVSLNMVKITGDRPTTFTGLSSALSELCSETSTEINFVEVTADKFEWFMSEDNVTFRPVTNSDTPRPNLSSLTTPKIELYEYGKDRYYYAKITNGACKTVETPAVKVEKCKIGKYVPNALSPNASGENAYWDLTELRLLKQSRITIFNRYGVEVYAADGETANNTKFDGNGLPAGTYYYVIQRNDGSKTKDMTGDITIVK